MSEQWIR